MKTGANARSTTSASQKLKKSMEKQRSLFLYFLRMTLQSLLSSRQLTNLTVLLLLLRSLRTLMNETASKLPEYPVVMAMKGVGTSLGPQLMAEIGDVSRFTHKGAITAFAGVDPGVNESGSYEQKSVPTSKRGSSEPQENTVSGNGCLNQNTSTR